MSKTDDSDEMLMRQIGRVLDSREQPKPAPPSEIVELTKEIRNFTEKVTDAVADAAAVALSPSSDAELAEILKEMKSFNSKVASVLSRPEPTPPMPPAPVASLPPIVHVAAPSVSVSPNIQIEPAAKRWKFTVTRRDQTAQQRIQEIIIEAL